MKVISTLIFCFCASGIIGQVIYSHKAETENLSVESFYNTYYSVMNSELYSLDHYQLTHEIRVSIESDTASRKIFVYPNPTERYVYLESSDKEIFSVYDSKGAQLITVMAEEKVIDLGLLLSGVYYIKSNLGRSEKIILK